MWKWVAAIAAGVLVGSFIAVYIGALISIGMYGMFTEFSQRVTTELERLESLIERAIDSKWN